MTLCAHFTVSTYVVLLRAEGRRKHVAFQELNGFIPNLQISDGASVSLRP